MIDPMRWLRRRPPPVGAVLFRITLRATRNENARELEASRRGANGNVVGVIGRQAGITHGADHAETTEGLHRARADDVGAHAWRFAGGAHFGERHANAALGKVHSQRQPDRAAADDQDISIDPRGHGNLRCSRVGARKACIGMYGYRI